jgi:hypothetical protein
MLPTTRDDVRRRPNLAIRGTLMTTITPTKPPFGLNATIWILIVAGLLVAGAAMAVYFR